MTTTAEIILQKLEPFNLKAEGQTDQGESKYRCNSPLRPGSDSHAFIVLVSPDGEHGGYFEHTSGEKGSLYELAKRLNITPAPFTEPIPIITTKRVYRDRADYAAAHGVSEDVFDAAGWRYDPWYDSTTKTRRPALKFSTDTGDRWRLLDADSKPYRSVKGYHPCWYGLARALRMAKDDGKPLVLCNGEPSTVVAQSFDVAAFAVTGGEKDSIPDSMLSDLRQRYPAGQIVVAMDCDVTGRKSARGIAKQLTSVGYEARAVNMRLDRGGDLADFCALRTSDAANDLLTLPVLAEEIESERAIRNKEPALVHADRLVDLRRPEWLIQDILPDHGICMVFGRPGEFKSFYVCDMAFRIAQTTKVVYVAAEGVLGYKNRTLALQKHTGLPNGELFFYKKAVQMLDPAQIETFIEEVRMLVGKPTLIVLDTLARTMLGGDENSTKDMSRYALGCEQIQLAFDCTVLVVHHMGKNGRDPRGSSVVHGNFDVIVRLTKADDLLMIECYKTKDAEDFKTHYKSPIEIELPDNEKSLVLVDAELVVDDDSDKLTQNQTTVLTLLAQPVYLQDGLSFSEIKEQTDMQNSSLARVLSSLLTRKYVKKELKSHVVTDKGRERLQKDFQVASSPVSPSDESSVAHSLQTNNDLMRLRDKVDYQGKTDATKHATKSRSIATKHATKDQVKASKVRPNATKAAVDLPPNPNRMFKDSPDKPKSNYDVGA